MYKVDLAFYHLCLVVVSFFLKNMYKVELAFYHLCLVVMSFIFGEYNIFF